MGLYTRSFYIYICSLTTANFVCSYIATLLNSLQLKDSYYIQQYLQVHTQHPARLSCNYGDKWHWVISGSNPTPSQPASQGPQHPAPRRLALFPWLRGSASPHCGAAGLCLVALFAYIYMHIYMDCIYHGMYIHNNICHMRIPWYGCMLVVRSFLCSLFSVRTLWKVCGVNTKHSSLLLLLDVDVAADNSVLCYWRCCCCWLFGCYRYLALRIKLRSDLLIYLYTI